MCPVSILFLSLYKLEVLSKNCLPLPELFTFPHIYQVTTCKNKSSIYSPSLFHKISHNIFFFLIRQKLLLSCPVCLPSMATRFLSPKLLKNLRCFTRPLNSASSASATAVSPLNYDEKPEPTTAFDQKQPKTSVHQPTITTSLDFDDHQKLFASVSTSKLLRSSANLGLAANEPFVDFGMWVMNSRLMETSLIRDVILKTVKHTFFEHFCAGETTEEAGDSIRKLHQAGLRGMLVYAVEHTTDNIGCDRNLEGFLKSVEFAKSLPPSSVSFFFFKFSL